METSISKRPHASECTPEMVGFIWGEMQQRIQYGISILLPAVDAVRMFGAKLKISCIMVVTQAHHQPRLVLNLS